MFVVDYCTRHLNGWISITHERVSQHSKWLVDLGDGRFCCQALLLEIWCYSRGPLCRGSCRFPTYSCSWYTLHGLSLKKPSRMDWSCPWTQNWLPTLGMVRVELKNWWWGTLVISWWFSIRALSSTMKPWTPLLVDGIRSFDHGTACGTRGWGIKEWYQALIGLQLMEYHGMHPYSRADLQEYAITRTIHLSFPQVVNKNLHRQAESSSRPCHVCCLSIVVGSHKTYVYRWLVCSVSMFQSVVAATSLWLFMNCLSCCGWSISDCGWLSSAWTINHHELVYNHHRSSSIIIDHRSPSLVIIWFRTDWHHINHG